jgi:hypothetical protein
MSGERNGMCAVVVRMRQYLVERKCPDNPIQTSFDFNVDLEELKQLDSAA